MNPPSLTFGFGATCLGTALVAASPKGICALFLGDDRAVLEADLRRRFPKTELHEAGANLGRADFTQNMTAVTRWLDTFSSKNGGKARGHAFPLALDLHGTAFQQAVWKALAGIPFGTTVSYTEIAQQIGKPRAVRAVAQACGANPVAVAIPCHRVLRRDGGLSGYYWGVDYKKALLRAEGASFRELPFH